MARLHIPTCLLLLLGLVCLAPGPLAAELRPALSAAQVDWAATGAFADGRALPPPAREAVLAALGLQADGGAWETPALAEQRRDFVLVFTEPVALGTLVCPWADTTHRIARLLPDVAGAIDPLDESLWQTLPDHGVRTLDPGVTTRALRLTHHHSILPWERDRRPSRFPPLLLLRERAYSPLAFPGGTGGATWRSAADPTAGAEFVAFWPVDRALAAVVLAAPADVTLAALAPAAAADAPHPLSDAAVWRPVASPSAPALRVVGVPPDTVTRALRLSLPGNPQRRDAWLQPLVLLGDAPVPAGYLAPAPVVLSFAMPTDGFAAVRLRDAAGREIRRLAAERALPAGPASLPWDLLDDAGNPVPPGVYHWRAVARPPLRLTYQGTVYNAGMPPWNAAVTGGGAWMADHSPPVAVASVGDRIFLAALGAEFGDAMIATDPDGRKLWASSTHAGAPRLLADTRYIYELHDSHLVRIDPQTYRRETILQFSYSETAPPPKADYIAARHLSGTIAGDRLFLSVDGQSPPWIRSALRGGDFDLSNSFPPPDGAPVHDTAYTSQERILGAFLTITSSQQAYFGDTVSSGPHAGVLLLRLRRSVPVGSIMLPAGIQAYALREGRSLPTALDPRAASGADANLMDDPAGAVGTLGLPDLDQRFDAADWIPLAGPEPGMALARAERGLRTRTLVFTAPGLKRLPYALVLDRRYRNATADATLVPLEGSISPTGAWTQSRPDDRPISAGNPAVCAVVWQQSRPIRGFAICQPFPWSTLAVDSWIGPDDAPIDHAAIADDSLWREVHRHSQTRNDVKMNWHTNAVIHADLGAVRSVRAFRVRIIDPSRPPDAQHLARRGGFAHFVAFEPLGDDLDLPVTQVQRITEIQLPASGPATVLGHHAVPAIGPIAAAPDGTLYVVSAGAVMQVQDLTAEPIAMREVVPAAALQGPIAMAVDRDGLLYVLQLGSRRCIDVFDPNSGTALRRIGTPGGLRPGPYDPTRFSSPVALHIDARDKVWVVEQDFQPKRITRWSRDGVLEREFYGPTHYGGGGMIDPRDHGVINYHGMKFRLDPATGSWRLEAILHRPGEMAMNTRIPGRVIYFRDRRYLAADVQWTLFGDTGEVAAICAERDGVAVPLAVAGNLGNWSAYRRDPALQAAWKAYDPSRTAFVWSDRNGDGQVQLEESQVRADTAFTAITFVGEDLSFNFSGWRLPLRDLSADGTPIYDLAAVQARDAGERWTGPDGEAFVMGHRLLDAQGATRWTYPDAYMGVQASARGPGGFANRPPGVLVGGLRIVGRFVLGEETYYTVLGNHGDWYTFTADGMLAACIFGGPTGYGKRYFGTPEAEPGRTDLSDLRTTVEDFYGNVVRGEDGHVYALAGKNHLTLIRVDGLEHLQRFSGQVTVTAEDLNRTQAWVRERDRLAQAQLEPRVLRLRGRQKPPLIDGDVAVDWVDQPKILVREQRDLKGEVVGRWTFALAWDHTNLYVCAQAYDESPMRNGAADWRLLHQGGDALDLVLNLDAAAPTARDHEPLPADRRVVIGVDPAGRPRVVLMRHVGPDATAEPAHVYRSPIAATPVAELRLLSDASVGLRRDEREWTLEAAIPWASLGATAPAAGATLRGDVGYLLSDEAGLRTVDRFYWANRRHVVMGDLPAESRLDPAFWGAFRFDPIPEAIDTVNFDDLGGDGPDLLLP